jgi:hypothetical protein
MRVIHVLRKPLSEGTVAANTLRHGTGGLNIDASRVSAPEALVRPSIPRTDNTVLGKGLGRGTQTEPGGRWPANLILQHLDGCWCDGVKRVKSENYVKSQRGASKGVCYADYEGHTPQYYGNIGEDGRETVANWVCVEGCPVRALDEQTADRLHLAGNVNNNGTGDGKNYTASAYHISYEGQADRDQSRRDTTTGASRFFKQVGGKTDG